MKKNTPLIMALLGLALGAPLAEGQTVAWGTSVSENPLSFDSKGNVDNEVMTWQLGWFNDGFIPDQTNYLEWAANWNAVSGGPSDTGEGIHQFWDDIFWAVSVNTADVGAAAAGKQEYIFAFNDLGLIGTDQGEALLLRQDGFLFPASPTPGDSFDIADNPYDTNDDALTVIWGRVDRNMTGQGGIVTGGGEFSMLVADSNAPELQGTFEAQFATWVPEPSTALLGAIGSLALMRRKRPSI